MGIAMKRSITAGWLSILIVGGEFTGVTTHKNHVLAALSVAATAEASATVETAQNFATFGDWCLNRASLTPEARHTVEVLLAQARTQECNQAEAMLAIATRLTFNRTHEIVDVSPLASLPHLTALTIQDTSLVDIAPLARLTHLNYLDLSGNQITDVTPLARLENLTELDLHDNRLTDVTPLASLTELTRLNLSGNDISDVTPLASLTNLTELWLSDNQITNVAPLAALPRLSQLYLGENSLRDRTCPVPETICHF